MNLAARPFITYERVRWADVDLVGIMRFSAFTRVIEYAEQELWREAGLPYATLFDKPEVLLPRRHLAIEYSAPAYIDDKLALVTYVSRLGETALTFNVDVMDADVTRRYAAASMVTVCVRAETFRKQPLPSELRAAFAPFHLDVDAARASLGARVDEVRAAAGDRPNALGVAGT